MLQNNELDSLNFRLLFENCPGLYLILLPDPDFTIVAVSDAYLNATMVKREDILWRGLFDVFPDNPNDPTANGTAQLRASLTRVMENKARDTMAIQKYDIRMPKEQGGHFVNRYWSPVNFPILNSDGEIQYLLHSVEDVTEMVKLKQDRIQQEKETDNLRHEKDRLEKIRQSQRLEAMGQLAGGVAHDFNNLLATITILCESSLSNSQISESEKINLEKILKTSEKASSLTRKLLAFSRNQVLQPKVINLNAVITEMKDLLSRLLNTSFELQTNLADNLGNTIIDPGQFEQIILNLVVNARDAMPNGGKITVSTSNETLDSAMSFGNMKVNPGNYVMVAVRDSGIGMDAQTQARIFEPFFTTKPAGKGTGLGLATVYGIVSQNKGTVWVYSELNKGTVFKIYFPLIDQEVTKTPVVIKRKNEPPKESKTILIVEDQEDLRETVCSLLQATGYIVHKVENGLKALSFIEQFKGKIDLIISDVIMPEMGGPALAKNLALSGHNIKFLFLSGYSDDVISNIEHFKYPPEFVEKPFKFDLLLSKIQILTTE